VGSVGRPDRVELDTPHGRLVVTWPRPQLIYAEPLEPVAAEDVAGEEPYATLDGRQVSMDRVRQIITAMRQGEPPDQAKQT
jgi:hypothetical protein